MSQPSKDENLPSGLSTYIDLLRVLAALLVMVSHVPFSVAVANTLSGTNFAYDAVIIFFVLSGYVISYAAETLEGSFSRYTVNRLARILPVATVSVALAAIFLATAGPARPDLYGPLPPLAQWPEIAFRCLTFTNEIWTTHITPFANGPYWSLSFEVWCYVFYGVAIYTRRWSRVVLLLALAAFLGPKQLIMLPMWLAGAAAYHLRNQFNPTKAVQIALAGIPIVVYFLIQIPMPRDWSYAYVGSKIEAIIGFGLDGAANSGWGYILALLVSLHLYAVGQLTRATHLGNRLKTVRLVKFLASYTFTLYLFHGVFLKFLSTLLGINTRDHNPVAIIPLYLLVFACIYLVGNLVEKKKALYRRWVQSLISDVPKLLKIFAKA